MIKNIKRLLPGFFVALGVALVSMYLATYFPKLGAATIAILLGIVVGNLFFKQEKLQAGYKFAETDLLSYAIVLLGGTVSFSALAQIGIKGILFIVLQMSITIGAVLVIGKKLGFSENFRYLMASGNAVCGSSAIAATAPVIDADDSEKGIAITIVNVIGIFLMFIIPLITWYLYRHEPMQTSAMTGGVLQSVGQVVASGAMVSEEVKDLATLFKIVRVILLVAVVFLFGHMKQRSNREILEEEIEDVKKGKVEVPWYVIGFFIMCLLFSIGIIPKNLSYTFKSLSSKLEIIALAAIGLRVNIKQLMAQGKAASIYALSIGCVQLVAAVILIELIL